MIASGQERRRLDWTPLKNISPVLMEAVIQAEDKRFYEHGGVDYRSLGSLDSRTHLRGLSRRKHDHDAVGLPPG